ncbi:MAG: integration host factor subunit beta [Deltaproteobacteria bacterium]|nr:integration host factor subunit beta [Deltaproteobacteria bacterium]
MTRSELIKALAREMAFGKDRAARVVEVIFESIASALERGESVEIRGFGRFSVRMRRARQARNPKSGAIVDLPERVVPWFAASQALRKVERFSTSLEMKSPQIKKDL